MRLPWSCLTFGGSPRGECAPRPGCRHAFPVASQEGRGLAGLGSQWPFRAPEATAHGRLSSCTPRLRGLRRPSEHLTDSEWPSQHRCRGGSLHPPTELRGTPGPSGPRWQGQDGAWLRAPAWHSAPLSGGNGGVGGPLEPSLQTAVGGAASGWEG